MNAFIKATLGAATFAVAGIGAVIIWPIGQTVQPITLTGDAGRGGYLARASGCIACHSDGAAKGAPLAGGVKITTPFGAIYTPNITTDRDHGIGDWNIDSFAKAVRQGISPQGSPYYPAFTYPFYANYSDQDIADLWAAFQTVPPVATPSRPNDMAFPFNQRWGLKLWRAAYLVPPTTKPVAGKTDIWNRGRDLTEGAAHCAACHTPRNLFGARKSGANLTGNPALPDGGKAPAIDAQSLRNNNWDVVALAYALQTGVTPKGDTFSASMGEVVLYGTSFLTPQDRTAIATYLLDITE